MQANTIYKKTLFSSTISLLSGQALSILLGYLLIIYLARLFTPDEYGAYAFSISIISWLELVLTIGFHNYIISFDVKNNKPKIRKIIFIQIVTASVFSILVLICAFLFYYNSNQKIFWIMALAVLDFIPFALYSTNVAILNELKKFHHQSALMVAYSFFKLAFMVVLSELFFSIEIAVIGMALSSFLTLLLSYSSLLKTYWEKPLVSSNTPQLHDLHSIAISVFIVIATGILINIDFWCLKANNPDDMVLLGKYGVVANFSRAFYFIVSIIFYKYFVLLKDHASVLNSMKSWSVLKNLLTVGMLFLANILIVYTILGRVVSLFFGEAYIEAVIIGREILPYQTAFFVSIFMLQSFFYTSLKIAVLIMLILNISLFYFLVNLLYPLHDLSSLRYAFCTIIVMNVIFFLSLIITDSQQFKSLGKKRLL